MDWFLYNGDLRHEKIKKRLQLDWTLIREVLLIRIITICMALIIYSAYTHTHIYIYICVLYVYYMCIICVYINSIYTYIYEDSKTRCELVYIYHAVTEDK